MLKRTREIVAAAGEAVGFLTPSVADAQSAAEQRRQDLVTAQAAIVSAEEALQAAHDRGAEAPEITRLEAALADARLTAERGQRAYTAAEKRLTAARAAESEKAKGAMRVRLAEANQTRAKLAERIDAGAREIAECLADFKSQDNTLREAITAGVLKDSTFALNCGQRFVELALQKAGAIEGGWIGDPATRPGCVQLVAQHNSALSAV